MLEVKNVGYQIGEKIILDGITTSFEPGKLSVIIGPNGSGKSTLLKIISHEITRYTGAVFYDHTLLKNLNLAGLAKKRAVLSQHSELSFPLMVEEVVMMGRYPHFNFKPAAIDLSIVNEVLNKMEIAHLRHRNYLTLSGGEKQKTHYARVLAQIWNVPDKEVRYLFLDEPIAFMDLNYQHEFLRIARSMANANTLVIAVLHDLNLALQYADRVFAINKGKLIAADLPQKVITPDLIREMYGIGSRMIHDNQLDFPLLIAE
jgi:iron complex transport system ATP-binding protein